ncbi:N-acetyltransferase family protein [Anatilimnocola sp. NA78]|uniref:GNAT family N-acetyltransferase n=1 Tax=Anatilimnocola sp. NA78 TaxID=3415683 RepID=UPI003CE496B9
MTRIVRRATLDDAQKLIEFVEHLYREESLQFHAERCHAALQALLQSEQLGFVIVGCVEQELAAYAVTTYGYSLEFGGRFALLDEIFVQPAYRGQGWGTTLMDAIYLECQRNKVLSLRLEVEQKNLGAQGLYRRLGFIQHDRHLMTRWIEQPT